MQRRLISKVALLVTVCASFSSAYPMMGRYLMTFVGDSLLMHTVAATVVNQEEYQKFLSESNLAKELTSSQHNFISNHAALVTPYVPVALPVGGALAIAGRAGMILSPAGILPKLGGAVLAVVSVPINAGLNTLGAFLALQNAKNNPTLIDTVVDYISKRS